MIKINFLKFKNTNFFCVLQNNVWSTVDKNKKNSIKHPGYCVDGRYFHPIRNYVSRYIIQIKFFEPFRNPEIATITKIFL